MASLGGGKARYPDSGFRILLVPWLLPRVGPRRVLGSLGWVVQRWQGLALEADRGVHGGTNRGHRITNQTLDVRGYG